MREDSFEVTRFHETVFSRSDGEYFCDQRSPQNRTAAEIPSSREAAPHGGAEKWHPVREPTWTRGVWHPPTSARISTTMPIYRLAHDAFYLLPDTSFSKHGIKERSDLQRLLRANIAVVAPDVLVIAEEFAEWEDSKRRIDLLGVDRAANLVVIELKRDDGGHMELQAIRYAAMVSTMTFTRAVEVFQSFLDNSGATHDAQRTLLEFLEWNEPREDDFAREVRIVLVSADFSKELTTAVLWLNDAGLNIQCVRLKPYDSGQDVLIDAQKIIPLPEASDYQEKLRNKTLEGRVGSKIVIGTDTGYWFMNVGENNAGRSWEDCRKYGFMTAGGGKRYSDAVKGLKVGDKFFAYLSGHGYVGLGEVIAEAVPLKDFKPTGQGKLLPELPLNSKLDRERNDDPEQWDLCAAVKWIRTVDRNDAVLMNRARMGTINRIRQADLVVELLKHFAPPTA